jgi:hypothetical protein
MMKRNLILLLILGSCSFFAEGQEIKTTPEILLQSSTKYEIIGNIDNVPMLLLDRGNDITIYAYDENMRNKWERDLKFEKRNAKIVGVVAQRKSFSVYYKYKTKGRVHLRMREYDNQLKLKDSTLVKLYPRQSFSPNPSMYLSKNKSKLLFLHADEDTKLTAIVFDNKTKKQLRDLSFSPPNFSYREDFLDALVDNQGGIHLVSSKDNKKSKKETNRLEIMSFLANDSNFLYYSANFGARIWYDLELAYDNINQKLLVSGYYSEESTTEAHGIFYMNIDPKEPANLVSSYNEFDLLYLKLIKGKEVKKNVGFGDVIVQKIIPRRDGGILMIAERNKKVIRNLNGYNPSLASGQAAIQTDYYYNEILLYSFHPDGSIHWKEILHKKQYSQDDNAEYSSFFLFLNKRSLRFLYNDTIKKGDTVYEYKVNGLGGADRKSLFNTKSYNFMLKLREALQISGNEVIVPSERRSQLKLVRLTF